jgi:hypothetical protein
MKIFSSHTSEKYSRKIVYCNLKAIGSYEFRKIKPSNKLERLTNEGKRTLQ